MRRRSFLLNAAGLACLVGGGLWLKDNVLWRKPDLSFGPEGSGWLEFVEARTAAPVVEAVIAGRKVRALLDTGAQYSVIDRSLVDSLGLGEGFDLPLVAYGVGGQPQAGRGVSLDLRLGQLDVPNLRAAILDLGPLADEAGLGTQLVLGQDLFGASILELDVKARRVRLSDPETFTPSSEMQAVTVAKKGAALSAELTVEGAVITAVIDTGFTSTLALSTTTATTCGLLDGRPEEAGSSLVLGGMAPARIIEVKTLTFDRKLWRGIKVQVFGDSPLPNYPQALLGMEAFEGRRVALDLGQGRLFQSGELDLTVG